MSEAEVLLTQYELTLMIMSLNRMRIEISLMDDSFIRSTKGEIDGVMRKLVDKLE